MFLYSFRRVYGDSVDDDFAICRAWSKKHAIKKFKRMYSDDIFTHFTDKVENCVERVKFNHCGISVLSDY